MRSIGLPAVLVSAVLALTFATRTGAGPTIAGFHPARLYVCDPARPAVRQISMDGSGLVAPDTNGRTFPSDVKVLVRHSGGFFVPARVTGWDDTELDLELTCADVPQTSPGALEFQVVVRGALSNIGSVALIRAPTDPPIIESVSPSHFNTGLTGTFDYVLRVSGKNVRDDTQAFVAGEKVQIARAYFADGLIEVWLPNDLRSKSGSYPVKLVGSNGTSNEMQITVGYQSIVTNPNPNPIPIPRPTSNPFSAQTGSGFNSVLTSMDVHMRNVAGHVTLTGSVASIDVKRELLRAVKSMPGVVDVADQVTIAAAPPANALPPRR
jgi:hypothetical protein